MDTITHGIVGALAGRALFAGRDVPAVSADAAALCSESDPVARAAITACTLGAMFPDIDVFAGPIAHNPLAIIEWHRNITHSLVMLPIWALPRVAAGLSGPSFHLTSNSPGAAAPCRSSAARAEHPAIAATTPRSK